MNINCIIISVYVAYEESNTDSTGVRLLHSIVNALIFLGAILVTTVIFVLLYKYRCLKVIYGEQFTLQGYLWLVDHVFTDHRGVFWRLFLLVWQCYVQLTVV